MRVILGNEKKNLTEPHAHTLTWTLPVLKIEAFRW